MYPTSDVGPAQGIREHVQVTFPVRVSLFSLSLCMLSKGCFAVGSTRKWVFGHVPRDIVPDPTQAAFPGPSSGHRAPTLGQPVPQNLRRLASRYVHHPDSHVEMVRMEPSSIGRYKVVIVLEMADFL